MLRFLALSALVAAVAAIPSSFTPTRDVSSSCASAIVTSSRSAKVGNNTVLLEVLTCAAGMTPTGPVAEISIGQAIESFLCHIIPFFCPPKPFKPQPKPAPTKTIVETQTATATVIETATVVQTATEVIPSTVTVVDPTTIATTIITPTTIIAPTTIVVTAAPAPTAPAATDVCGEICNVSCSNLGVLPPDSDDCQIVKDSIQVFQGSTSPTFTVAPLHVQQLTFGTCRFFFENLGTTPLEACWSDLSQQGSLASTTCFPPTQPVMSLAVCEALDTTWEIGVSHS